MVTKESYMNGLLDEYSTIMATTLLARTKEVGHDVWPSPIFHPMEGDVYAAKYLFPRLYHDICELRNRMAEEDIARLFLYPSRLARITYLFHACHFSNLPKKERVSLAGTLLSYLTYLRSDVFVKTGNNIILDEGQLNGLGEGLEIVNLGKARSEFALKKFIGKLIALLWSYCEILYFCHHQIGHEYHGPYRMGDQKMLVRDYYELKPVFWDFAVNFPYSRLLLVTLYKGIEIKFDYSNRTYVLGGDLHKNLRGFSVVVDSHSKLDRLSTRRQLLRLIKEVKTAVSLSITEVSKLERIDLMKKYGEMFFFATKPLRDALGEDWWPPADFYSDIEGQVLEGMVSEFISSLKKLREHPQSKQFRFLKMRLDPRSY